MAQLKDRASHYSLELTPVQPSREGPRHSYDVILREYDQVLFQRRYSAPEPYGHRYVWRLFRAFQLAERMARTKTTFNVTGRRARELNEDATVNVCTDWLDVILSCDTTTHTHGQPQPWNERRCWVKMYLLDDEQDMDTLLPASRCFTLRCHPEAAVAFGKMLEEECRRALDLRRRLGLEASLDDILD